MKIIPLAFDVDQLLNDTSVYSVPSFQRSYAWEEEHLEDYWADLFRAMGPKSKSHFLGTMVVTPQPSSKSFSVLDGQQRFATSLLLLAALRANVKKSKLPDKTDRVEAINKLLFVKDAAHLGTRPKIQLNRQDRDFFHSIIVSGSVLDPVFESNRLLAEAYDFFLVKTKALVSQGSGEVGALLETLLRRFVLLRIEVDSETNAYAMFEAMNDRGLDLSVADLVKNHVLSMAEAAGVEIADLLQRWEKLVERIGEWQVTTFLRHYWLSKHGLVRKEELFDEIKDKVQAKNAKTFLEELNEESEAYENLIDPTSEFWIDAKTKALAEELAGLGVSQVRVMLLGICSRFNNDKIALTKLLTGLVNFTFRYTTIGKENPNELEKLYSSLAVEVRKGKISPDEILLRLQQTGPSEAKFRTSFLELEVRSARLGRYILGKISDQLVKEAGMEELMTNKTKINWEHIIPRKPNPEWNAFLRSENISHGSVVHKLGNQTLLLDEYNKKLSNRFFSVKQEMYKQSKLPMNDSLTKKETFGLADVEGRQAFYEEIASKVWNLR